MDVVTNLKGYVGPEDKLYRYFGRKVEANDLGDLEKIRVLLNNVPHRMGGPEPDIETFRPSKVFEALERFQKVHKIVNKKGKPYGWTGPKGSTLGALYRASRDENQGARPRGYLDISNLSYQRVAKHFLSRSRFKTEVGDRVFSSKGKLSEASRNVNTCALQVSYALLRAGVPLRVNQGSWRYESARTGREFWLTSTAERMTNEFKNGTMVFSKRDVAGKKGIIVFLGGYTRATGHVTLWKGNGFQLPQEDRLWRFKTIYFYQMQG